MLFLESHEASPGDCRTILQWAMLEKRLTNWDTARKLFARGIKLRRGDGYMYQVNHTCLSAFWEAIMLSLSCSLGVIVHDSGFTYIFAGRRGGIRVVCLLQQRKNICVCLLLNVSLLFQAVVLLYRPGLSWRINVAELTWPGDFSQTVCAIALGTCHCS